MAKGNQSSNRSSSNKYPLPSFHFQVEWGGTNIGFQEVTGLDLETEILEYRSGSSPSYSTIKMPGLEKHSNITLKRGVFEGDIEFYTWYQTIQLNKVERRDLTIKLLNDQHEPALAWRIRDAWPVKIVGPQLQSEANEIAIESMEIAHEGISIVQ